jgi:hypothetical protein
LRLPEDWSAVVPDAPQSIPGLRFIGKWAAELQACATAGARKNLITSVIPAILYIHMLLILLDLVDKQSYGYFIWRVQRNLLETPDR